MKIPRAVSLLVESFQKLPGIGPKTAQRLTYYLLHVPQAELDGFSQAVVNLKKDTVLCSLCRNVGEKDPCSICSDQTRDKSVILVVEQPLDILAFEKTGKYKGVYHVLHGAINPLENIGPDEIYISDLMPRITSRKSPVTEVIIATNPTMEGEATAMYLLKKLKVISYKLKVTRLGMGIPTGADLEYADEVTLSQALAGRREM
ncbi:recombination protein RecR [Candidatus Woesebacteria bacterium CG_4_10_14_0_2_um_filter_44_9]|uniref:Recombination protein RecR n=2 Tax=Candidatus Woeseibacteriota TaxID=1752722 RepID=A0A2M7TIK4_9BACT|nr:MAG: recombination protein RecR [Candidatus Woesebacteria bacterium CG_4_10_14_0_2_um_filter_44_9]